MNIQLVYSKDSFILNQIKNKLITLPGLSKNTMFQKNFTQIIQAKNSQQPLFSIGISLDQSKDIQVIYSLHSDYKFTRQLCKCVHIQEIYKCTKINSNQIEKFQKNLIDKLDCYKIVALGIQENNTLKANQVFMTIQNRAQL